MAERDPDQDCGRSTTRRGVLLCPMWEEATSVSRCNEGESTVCDFILWVAPVDLKHYVNALIASL